MNNQKAIFMTVISLLLILPLGNSVIISGSDLKFTTFLEPGSTFSQTYRAVATTDNQDILFSVDGPLENYSTITPDRADDLSEGEGKSFRVEFDFPSDVEAGKLNTRICVLDVTESTGGISARTRSCARIIFLSLYEGKYVNPSLNVHNANAGDDVEIEIKVDNWGKKRIDSISGQIEIYEEGNKIDTVDTNTISLDSKRTSKLTAEWDSTGHTEGQYSAEAKVLYDGESKDAGEDSFRLGTLDLILKDYTRNVELGELNRFLIDVESGWNLNMPNVYAQLNLKEGGNTVASFKTSPEVVKPWSEKTLEGYLDTSSLSNTGEYSGEIILYFLGEKKKESILVNVTEAVQEASQERPSPEIESSQVMIVSLIVAVVILLAILIHQNKHGKKK